MTASRSSNTIIARMENSMRKRTHIIGGYLVGSSRGSRIDGAVVVAVTANAEAEFPLGVTDADEGAHVDSEGAPVQLIVTARLNPLTGVTCRL